MARSSIEERLGDYKTAFEKWLCDTSVHNLILVENSGFELSEFQEILEKYTKNGLVKKVEFISVDTQEFPRHLGKGYGETLALDQVVKRSTQLASTQSFLKVNGRYFVRNIKSVLSDFKPDSDIYCNLTKSMRWSDSRVFGGSYRFLRDCLIPAGMSVDDSNGRYLEHALADAFLTGVVRGMNWQFVTCRYDIEGVSGTLGKSYTEGVISRRLKDIANVSKQFLMKL